MSDIWRNRSKLLEPKFITSIYAPISMISDEQRNKETANIISNCKDKLPLNMRVVMNFVNDHTSHVHKLFKKYTCPLQT